MTTEIDYTDYVVLERSSAMRQAWYAKHTNKAYIEFKNAERIYEYLNISPEQWDEFLNSDSAGRYVVYNFGASSLVWPNDVTFVKVTHEEDQESVSEPRPYYNVLVRVDGLLRLPVYSDNVKGAIKDAESYLDAMAVDAVYSVEGVNRVDE